MDIRVLLLLLLEAVLAFFLLRRSGAIRNARAAITACLFLFLAFFIRYSLLDYETTDYQWFLTKWVDYYCQHGGFAGLKYSVGNYNIPYLYFLALFSCSTIRDLYLIKLLSIFFDVILAYGCMRLIQKCGGSSVRAAIGFFIILFLPTVILNSAKWGQCDSIYAAFAILGIELGLGDPGNPGIGSSAEKVEKNAEKTPAGKTVTGGRDRQTNCCDLPYVPKESLQHSANLAKRQKLHEILSVVCIAVSFSFKLQAVFIMPVYLVLWIWKKYRLSDVLIFPLTYFLEILPAVLTGRPLMDALLLYVDQAETVGTAMNYNSPSMTALIRNVQDPEKLSTQCIALAFLAMALLLAMGILFRSKLNSMTFLGLTLMMVLVIPFFLPHMHDRYFFLADCLTAVFACSMAVKKAEDLPEQGLRILAACCMQFGSLICYLAYFSSYYQKLGNIYLTNDRGAVAVIICMSIVLLCTLAELSMREAKPVRRTGKTIYNT